MIVVFLSSTGKDLSDHRHTTHDGLHRLDGFHCDWMEEFGAREMPPKMICEKRVQKAGVYVGILGHCYGHRPPDDDRSYTEIEYDAAVTAKLARLMFVAPDDLPTPANLFLLESEDDRKRQQIFRERVRQTETCNSKFKTPQELAEVVKDALYNHVLASRTLKHTQHENPSIRPSYLVEHRYPIRNATLRQIERIDQQTADVIRAVGKAWRWVRDTDDIEF